MNIIVDCLELLDTSMNALGGSSLGRSPWSPYKQESLPIQLDCTFWPDRGGEINSGLCPRLEIAKLSLFFVCRRNNELSEL